MWMPLSDILTQSYLIQWNEIPLLLQVNLGK